MKQKEQFLSSPENLADAKRKFYDVAHFSLFFIFFSVHFSLFMTSSTFHEDASHAPFSTGDSAVSSILEDD